MEGMMMDCSFCAVEALISPRHREKIATTTILTLFMLLWNRSRAPSQRKFAAMSLAPDQWGQGLFLSRTSTIGQSQSPAG
jgi:hypothetical protein